MLVCGIDAETQNSSIFVPTVYINKSPAPKCTHTHFVGVIVLYRFSPYTHWLMSSQPLLGTKNTHIGALNGSANNKPTHAHIPHTFFSAWMQAALFAGSFPSKLILTTCMATCARLCDSQWLMPSLQVYRRGSTSCNSIERALSDFTPIFESKSCHLLII